MADGLLPSSLGELAFRACSKNVDGSFTVSEGDILRATRVMARDAGIFAEPSGAIPLAPLLSGAKSLGRRVVLVVSGGNISHELLARILAS
jgi:threonine dehydratase